MGIFNFGRKEKQNVIRLKTNGHLACESISVSGPFIMKVDELVAWQRLREFCLPIEGFKSPFTLWMPVDDRSSLPLSPYSLVDKETMKKLTNPDIMAAEAHAHMLSQNEMEKHKAWANDMLSYSILALVFAIVLVGILSCMGKIDFGAMFNSFRGVR